MTTGTITHHCSECGEEVDDFCRDHPRAMVESIHTAHEIPVRSDAIEEGRTEEAIRLQMQLGRTRAQAEGDVRLLSRRPKQNPAWATKALAESYEKLQTSVDPKWLPKLSHIRAGYHGKALVGDMKELGCGAYGCVYPTPDDGVVMKLTTDSTEAEFAAHLATELAVPVTVHYYKVVSLPTQHKHRQIFLLWREEADKVGAIYKQRGYGRKARALIHEQHKAAQQAFELMQHKMKAYRSITEAVDEWKSCAEQMAEVPELEFLANGMLTVLEKQHVFFGDVHEGNLGLVKRDGQMVWAITDPGHVAVVK